MERREQRFYLRRYGDGLYAVFDTFGLDGHDLTPDELYRWAWEIISAAEEELRRPARPLPCSGAPTTVAPVVSR